MLRSEADLLAICCLLEAIPLTHGKICLIHMTGINHKPSKTAAD